MTQLPDVLLPDGGRYALQVLHLDYESIIPHFAVRARCGENVIKACTSFELTLYMEKCEHVKFFKQKLDTIGTNDRINTDIAVKSFNIYSTGTVTFNRWQPGSRYRC